jgi:Carboxypeptidase regulatory-like domain
MMLRSFISLAAFVLAVLPVAAPAETTGSIAGYVRDVRTGAPMAGVRVSAHSPGQVSEATTGADGFYVLLDLEPGRYVVITVKEGFAAVSLISRVDAGEQTFTRVRMTKGLVDCFCRLPIEAPAWSLGFGSTYDVYRLDPATNPLFDNAVQLSNVLPFVPGVQVVGGQSPP